ncbi:hypothetical protein ACFVJK_33205 [Streptomyces sp. NPDC127172]|uniref:hypothetical protein n=1 Tax=Streptomyces sp. NPDC127172 TaxID=3345382 RepID=UPI003627257E
MNNLSTRTLAKIIKIAKTLGTSDIFDLIMEANLWSERIDKRANRQEILRSALMGAHTKAARDDDALQALLDFVRCLVESDLRDHQAALIPELQESLRSDGYELALGMVDAPAGLGGWRYSARILPFDSSQAPLHQEMTALENDLSDRGYTTALGHYQLALKHFAEQDHPSSNSQLRTTLESLIVSLAVEHAGYVDNGKANQGGVAIKKLYAVGGQPPAVLGQPLPEKDGGTLIQGIWDISHLNGSHPGLSDAHEARIRMQLVTAAAQFLLRHFPTKP